MNRVESYLRKRTRHRLFFTFFLITLMGAAFVATTGYSDDINDDPVKPEKGETFAVFGLEIPDGISFAGEPVPLDLV